LPTVRRRLCSVGAIWSRANAKRPRRSSGAVVWFKPRAQTAMGPDYKICTRYRAARRSKTPAITAIGQGACSMTLLALLNHLLNFALPALAVALVLALAARLFMKRGAGAPGLAAQVAITFAAGV